MELIKLKNLLYNPKGYDTYQQFMDFWETQVSPSFDMGSEGLSEESKIIIRDFSRNENSVKVIFDNQKYSVLYISENLKDIFGYTSKEFMEYNMLLVFHSLAFEHLTMPIKVAKWSTKIQKNLPNDGSIRHFKLTICGLKVKDKNRRTLSVLARISTIEFTENDEVKTIIISVENISHLMKSNAYWARLVCGKEQEHKFYFSSDPAHNTGKDIVSNREKDVLRLIAKGMESKEIAKELFISTGTVENHRRNMIARTGARDTTALLQICISCGII
ncbi:MAG: helix-turn-helix transcriptional regulator [Saprospiraceae bacterium]|nr:helix-turn-helix transcriptional regulator [Saprospiraceae bacterium]